jgi:hypothetical protein
MYESLNRHLYHSPVSWISIYGLFQCPIIRSSTVLAHFANVNALGILVDSASVISNILLFAL